MIAIPLLLALGLVAVIQPSWFIESIAMVFAGIATVLKVLLTPLNKLIDIYLPELNNGVEAITSFFQLGSDYFAWIINATLVPKEGIVLIISYVLFAFSVTFGMWALKLAIKWKRALF